MKIEKQIQEDHHAKLIVEIDAEMMETYKRRAARKISERGKIPGFRPGKAPYEMIVRTYGEGAIVERAMDMLLEAEYPNILKEADVLPSAAGSVESMDSLTPPKLTLSVPLAPTIELGDYHSVRAPYEWIAPDASEVDAAILEFRQMYATTETVEREAQSGDYVLLDVESEMEELKRESFSTVIREEEREMEWPYPGFAKELIGMKAGDRKTVTHTFPEDWDDDDLKGKEATLTAAMKTVQAITLPEVDDEFARMIGAGETADAFREAITKNVNARSQAAYNDKYYDDLVDKLREVATIKYTPHTLEHECEHVLNDFRQNLAQSKLDLETYLKMRDSTLEKFKEETAMPAAKKRLEHALILDEVARLEKIEVEQQEVTAEFNNSLDSLFRQGMDPRKVRGGKEGQRRLAQTIAAQSMNRLLTRHTLELLKTIAIGEYKPKAEGESVEGEANAAEAESAARPEEDASAS